MIYLVTYDIESDRLRKKVADKILAWGLERVQYSVFMGPVSKPLSQTMRIFFENAFEREEIASQDTLLMLRLSPSEIQKMQVWGNDPYDREMLTGDKKVLIIGKEG